MNSKQAVTLANAAAQALQSFYSGLAMSLAGMLESPQFLFRARSRRTRPATSRRLSTGRLQQGVAAQLLSVERRARCQADGGGARTASWSTATGLADEVDRMIAIAAPGSRACAPSSATCCNSTSSIRWPRTRRSIPNGPPRSRGRAGADAAHGRRSAADAARRLPRSLHDAERPF